MRSFFISLLSFCFFISSLALSANLYCNNEQDYKTHMEFHRMRVALLAFYIFYDNTDKFFGVDEHTLVEYITTQHDFSKLDQDSVIAKKLMKFYGVPYSDQDEKSKRDLRDVISYMNKVDGVKRANFFKRKNITDLSVIDSYVNLETMADLIDRSYDPVASEEFGRKMYPASESEKIPFSLLPIVQKFESSKKYDFVTRGFEFQPIMNKCLWYVLKERMKTRFKTIRFQLEFE